MPVPPDVYYTRVGYDGEGPVVAPRSEVGIPGETKTWSLTYLQVHRHLAVEHALDQVGLEVEHVVRGHDLGGQPLELMG